MLSILSRSAIHFNVTVVSFLNFFASPIFPGSLFPRQANSDCFQTGLVQSLQKSRSILVILENGFTPITSVHHMIDRSPHNKDPKPFLWTKSAKEILAKVRRCKAVSVTLH